MDEPKRALLQTRVFISYSRKDKPFVEAIHAGIAGHDIQTWVDWEGIPLTADWWAEIKQGIERADAFAFIISPDSLSSKVCQDELETAVANNKRLIPILHHEPEKGAPMHAKLSSHNWVYMRDTAELEKNLPDLLTIINTDLGWVRAHTRLLERAIEWQHGERNPSLLLRGDDLQQAELWLSQASLGKEPTPTELQTEYIFASRQDATKRQRLLLVGVSVALVITILLAITSFIGFGNASVQRAQAETARSTAVAESTRAYLNEQQAVAESTRAFENEQEAVANAAAAEEARATAVANEAEAIAQRTAAEEQARIALAGALAARSQALEADNPVLSRLLAQEAVNTTYRVDQTIRPDAQVALFRALQNPIISAFNEQGYLYNLDYSPDGEKLLTASNEGAHLWDNRGSLLASFSYDSGLVFSLISASLNPAGDRIVTTYGDDSIHLWDTEGNELAAFQGSDMADSGYSPTFALFSPSGALLFAGGKCLNFGLEGNCAEGSAGLWDAEGEPVTRFAGMPGQANKAYFTPDETRLFIGTQTGQVSLWDVQGNLLKELPGHHWAMNTITGNAAGDRVVTTDWETAVLWDMDGNFIATLDDYYIKAEDTVYSTLQAVFSPDGERVLTFGGCAEEDVAADSCQNYTANLWDKDGRLLAPLTGHTGQVVSAAFHPTNGRSRNGRFLTTSNAGEVKLWEADGSLIADLDGYNAYVQLAQFTANGDIVTAGGNLIQRWDGDGRLRQSLTVPTTWFHAALHPQGQIIAGGSETGAVQVVLPDPDLRQTLPNYADGAKPLVDWAVDDVSFVADGTKILIVGDCVPPACERRTASLWDLDGNELARIQIPDEDVVAAVASADGNVIVATSGNLGFGSRHTVWDGAGNSMAELKETVLVSQIAINAPGDRIVTYDDTISLWQTDGTKIADLPTDAFAGLAYPLVQFSPDGSLLAVSPGCNNNDASTFACIQATASLWDKDGNPLAAVTGHEGAMLDMQFSPDNTRFLTAGGDHVTHIWDTQGNLLHTLSGHEGAVNTAVFNPSGDHILTASDDKTARLWDAEGNLIAVLAGHVNPVRFATFNGDGSLMVTMDCQLHPALGACDGSHMRLWNAEGTLLAERFLAYENLNDAFTPSAQFSPNGGLLLTNSGLVNLWTVWDDVETMLQAVEGQAGRPLTAEECHQYLHMDACP